MMVYKTGMKSGVRYHTVIGGAVAATCIYKMKWKGMAMDKNEQIISELIRFYFEVEWMRVTMYHEECRYRYIPFISYRIYDVSKTKHNYLISALESYEGRMKWKIFVHPRSTRQTYILSLLETNEWYEKIYSEGTESLIREKLISQNDYYGNKRFTELCDNAIEDIPALARYIQSAMKQYI
ncbi:hypothetical protein [Butyrivibrio sp. MC2021]|uniref:hypothetical protein n=1 Tax=Butyrivibrio sp. MC2021 TaxID=1408306 RepID=UPI0012DD12D5|nr:hypothetical protein [Butyrivibrio sp. MC2021]